MAGFSLTPFNIASYSNTCYFWIQSCSPEIRDSAVPFPAFPKSLDFCQFMISVNENFELMHCNVSWNYFQSAAMFWVLSSNLPYGNMGRNNNGGKTCEMPVSIFFSTSSDFMLLHIQQPPPPWNIPACLPHPFFPEGQEAGCAELCSDLSRCWFMGYYNCAYVIHPKNGKRANLLLSVLQFRDLDPFATYQGHIFLKFLGQLISWRPHQIWLKLLCELKSFSRQVLADRGVTEGSRPLLS